jgi:hypothetical protein
MSLSSFISRDRTAKVWLLRKVFLHLETGPTSFTGERIISSEAHRARHWSVVTITAAESTASRTAH